MDVASKIAITGSHDGYVQVISLDSENATETIEDDETNEDELIQQLDQTMQDPDELNREIDEMNRKEEEKKKNQSAVSQIKENAGEKGNEKPKEGDKKDANGGKESIGTQKNPSLNPPNLGNPKK